MLSKIFFPVLLGLFGLIRCQSHETAVTTGTGEQITSFAMNYEQKTVTVGVVSKGCTTKNDFSFTVNNSTLTLTRNKKDECKAMPDVMNISWSFDELGIDVNKVYKIANGFIANPNTANIQPAVIKIPNNK